MADDWRQKIKDMETAAKRALPKYLSSSEHKYYERMGYTRKGHISPYWEEKSWANAQINEMKLMESERKRRRR